MAKEQPGIRDLVLAHLLIQMISAGAIEDPTTELFLETVTNLVIYVHAHQCLVRDTGYQE